MNEREKVVARLCARRSGRALTIRSTSMLAADPPDAIGIVTIKIVTEEVVQAVGYGSIDRPPKLICRLDPMSRDASDLAPFAAWLTSAIEGPVRLGLLPRLWLPHGSTLECLDVLGHRFATNQSASADLQRMGVLCRLLAEETRFEGQQVVAVAAHVLEEHFITGQMPIEDNHLGARLAWINPVTGRRPEEVAVERSRKAASGILVNTPDQRDDDRVDRLRAIYKRGTRRERAATATQIKNILRAAIRREWAMLVEARRSFWSAGFAVDPLSDLVDASIKRLQWSLDGFIVPSRPHALASLLEKYEDAAQKREETSLLTDPVARNAERRRGRVLSARITAMRQPRSGRFPCTLEMTSDQELLRLRLDDEIKSCDGKVKGVVRDIARDRKTGGRSIVVEVTVGVRSTGRFVTGSEHEWIEANDYPLYLREEAFRHARDRGHWLLVGGSPPGPLPMRLTANDPLALANAIRRP
jgi:hypothetical protein